MKGSLLLAGLIVSVLAVREAPTDRMLRELSMPVTAAEIHATDSARGPEVTAVLGAWDKAYRAAVASERWEDLVDAGDAYRRIGEATGLGEASDATARGIYQAALSRARQQGSLDGVLRVAEAFAALGDREGLERSLRIAEFLAGGDPDARADLRAAGARFADLLQSRER